MTSNENTVLLYQPKDGSYHPCLLHYVSEACSRYGYQVAEPERYLELKKLMKAQVDEGTVVKPESTEIDKQLAVFGEDDEFGIRPDPVRESEQSDAISAVMINVQI